MIPVYEPWVGEEEALAVADAIRHGELSGLFGKSLERFESEFAAYVGCRYGVATSNCTTALELAVRVAGLEKGSEVLMNATTNIATALAVHYNDGVVVPVDSEARTWNLDLGRMQSQVTSKTRMILPMHHFGHPVDMHELMSFADEHNLLVIEDCAEAHGAECRGKRVGGFGHMACFSFLANKIITTGEGGMVVTNNPQYAERLKYLRSLGFGQPRFFHPEPAFNFRLTSYQAAMGLVQLGRIEDIIKRKRMIAQWYNTRLADLPELILPAEESWAFNVYWVYGVVLRSESRVSRDQLMQELKKRGVDSRTFFCPMNLQPFIIAEPGYRPTACPISEGLWKTGFYLPSGPLLKEEQVEFIADQLRQVLQPAAF